MDLIPHKIGLFKKITRLCMRVLAHWGIVGQVRRTREYYSNLFNVQLSGVVAYGAFKGLKLSERSHWGGLDRASMLLGLYELDVVHALISVPLTHRSLLIDLGGGDGYYGVGAVFSGLFERSIVFEKNIIGREIIKEVSFLNNVSNKVSINSEVSSDSFLRFIDDRDIAKVTILCDIEGYEFLLFNSKLFEKLSCCYIIIELHDHFFVNGETLLNNLLKFATVNGFTINYISTGVRDLSGIPELVNLSDSDRWLICSEGRSRLGRWLFLTPAF